jgi:hypothetical protein
VVPRKLSPFVLIGTKGLFINISEFISFERLKQEEWRGIAEIEQYEKEHLMADIF